MLNIYYSSLPEILQIFMIVLPRSTFKKFTCVIQFYLFETPVLNKMDLRKRKITLDFQFKISRWFLVSTYFTGTAYCPHNDLDTDLDLQHLSGRELVGDVYGVGLGPGQPQGLCSLSREVLEWNDAHPHQVTAVDTLVALGNHRLDSLL